MTRIAIITSVEEQMKEASSSLNENDYENAVADVEAETGWSLPTTSALKSYWFKHRLKRHLIFYLMTGSASKFQAKSFSLHQKFDHYRSVLDLMDAQWEKFKEEHPEELSVSSESFGTVIGTGSAYDIRGRSYDVDTI